MNIGTSPFVFPGTSPFVFPSVISGIFSRADGNVGIYTGNHLAAYTYGGWEFSSFTVPLDQWTQVVVTSNSSGTSLYANGHDVLDTYTQFFASHFFRGVEAVRSSPQA